VFADDGLSAIETQLDAAPAGWQPLSASAIDGYLAALALLPQTLPIARWLNDLLDDPPRPGAAPPWARGLHEPLLQRAGAWRRAVLARRWLDPWLFDSAREPSDAQTVEQPAEQARAAARPWVLGFALAVDAHLPRLQQPAADALEPMALLYLHFEPDELEDADALLQEIASLEPPADLEEAAHDIVASVFHLADALGVPAPPAPGSHRGRTASR
jgi:uncharacterized protein